MVVSLWGLGNRHLILPGLIAGRGLTGKFNKRPTSHQDGRRASTPAVSCAVARANPLDVRRLTTVPSSSA